MSMNSSILIEQPCYTLINLPQDAEQTTEIRLREDLEKGDNKVIQFKKIVFDLYWHSVSYLFNRLFKETDKILFLFMFKNRLKLKRLKKLFN